MVEYCCPYIRWNYNGLLSAESYNGCEQRRSHNSVLNEIGLGIEVVPEVC
jgi:hypothetical protein